MKNESNIESAYVSLMDHYSSLKEKSFFHKEIYEENEENCLNDSRISEFFKEIKEMNNIITHNINKLEIKTPEDLQLIYLKFSQVTNIFDDVIIGDLYSYSFIEDLGKVNFKSRIADVYDSVKIKKDIKKLKNIKRYIKDIFR